MNSFYSLREQFISFFKERGHVLIPSASLLPTDDSVLLTSAGMQQFKPYYSQEADAQKDFSSQRVVSIQKCFRTTDFDEVGDETHLTFFEMLGNFSFAPIGKDDPNDTSSEGYFKRSAIKWGYEFITNTLQIQKDRIEVTIFSGDEKTPRDGEAYRIWKDEIGIDPSRIHEGGREDNFWGPTGSRGPCGPTTEIYIDGIEIWNIVFNEYFAEKDPSGNMIFSNSEFPGIDTGMGFERLLSIIEKKDTIFETSAFSQIFSCIEKEKISLPIAVQRIIADHLRGIVFLIGDGVTPSNKEAGYVLRKLLRKLIALSIQYALPQDFFYSIQKIITSQYTPLYKELSLEKVRALWDEENARFKESISKGMSELEKMLERQDFISGDDAFFLYETFGVPFDVVKEMVPPKKQHDCSQEAFEKAQKKHQEISRSGSEKKFGGHGLVLDTGEIKAENEGELSRVIRFHTATHLLQAALRKVGGKKIQQMGSDINAKRLRFDFSAEEKLSDEDLKEVEYLVNKYINDDLPVSKKTMKKEDAEKSGALSFFKESYPDIVSVYSIGEGDNVVSKEFCGGPHVKRTSEIGPIKITKQESIGRGVKRIRAILA